MVKVDYIKHIIELSEGVGLQLTATLSLPPRMASPSLENLQAHAWNLDERESRGLCGPSTSQGKGVGRYMGRSPTQHEQGIVRGFEYRLKAVYSHSNDPQGRGFNLIINNLFGERVPRQADLPWTPAEVTVKIENKTEVVVSGVDKEKVDKPVRTSSELAAFAAVTAECSKMEFTSWRKHEEGYE